MNKIRYVVEEEETYNGGDEFDNFNDAMKYFIKVLHDYANYNYQINKDKVFTLSKVISNDDENDNWETLKSIAVKDFKYNDALKWFTDKR